jgi:putative ABC transport system permease protein
MLFNYLKIAWKVLLRRKFFTFISLFGISFTLMIMLVVAAIIDHVTGPQAPEKRVDRLLFVTKQEQRFKDGGNMNSPVSSYFMDRYVRTMKTPALVGISSVSESATSFANNQSLNLDVRFVDANYWKVTDHDLLDGRVFTEQEVKSSSLVCVINEHTARAFFGTVKGVAGRQIEVGPHNYRVAGVVPNVAITRLASSADVWVPYTLSTSNFQDKRIDGPFLGIILAPSAEALPAVREEFRQLMKRVEIPNPKFVKELHVYADPMMASFTRELMQRQTTEDDGLAAFMLTCTVVGLLFMLLPALNLVNLNVTRIMERSSEIGVRKAFGASGQALVGQFLVENLVLAALGGLLGLGLAAGALSLLNSSNLFVYSHFTLDWRLFGWGLGLAVVFGLMSGVYPAWKMSRLNPVDALRGAGSGPQ